MRIGQTIAGYEIIGELGEGGMGKVYKVRNLISKRVEAMKVLLSGPGLSGDAHVRFEREIRVQASLDHPNIARVYGAQVVGTELVMLMEFIDGVSLKSLIVKREVDLGQSLDCAAKVLNALSHAHSAGIIHRDIKPANIMRTSSGSVKLLDFGTARMNAEHKITETGLVVGTLAYISPEQIEHNIADARSDVYSLGITLYEMVTGRIPFDGDRQAVLLGHLRRIPAAPIEVNPKVPLPISAAIMKAISKDPEKRFQTAAEFRAELSSDPTSRITPLMGRRRLVAAIGVAGTAAGFATWRIAQTPNVSVPAHKVQPQSNDLQPKTDALPGPGGIAEGTGSAIPAPIPEADHTPRKSIAKIQKSEPQQPPKDLVDELERAQKRLNVADSRLAWLIAKQKELGLAPGDRMTSDLDTAKRSLEKVGQLLRAGRLTEAREQLRRGEMLVRRFENELGR